MTDGHRFALLVAQMVAILRDKPAAVEEQKQLLGSIGELTARRSFSVRLEGEGPNLVVEGAVVPTDAPPLPQFVAQMLAHDVIEIQVSQGVSALGLMHLSRCLAIKPGGFKSGTGVQQSIAKAQFRRVRVFGVKGEDEARLRRGKTPTEAVVPRSEPVSRPVTPAASTPGVGVPKIHSGEVAPPIEDTIAQIESGRISLGAAAKKLKGVRAGPQLTNALDKLAGAVVRAVRENKNEDAIEAIISVIRQEREAPKEDIRLACGVALRRMLGSEVLRPFANLLLDPLYADDLMIILARAGTDATQLLLDLLVAAPTFAERRAYMTALVKLGDEGTENVIAMLSHHQWYVVRNVADLVAELGIEQAVPALGKVASHEDARVRKSVAIALAKVGTPAAARHLHATIRDEDATVRMTVAQEIVGAGLSGLVMPLVHEIETEEEPQVREEFCRALGRIGTSEAVRALENVARRKGNVFTTQRPTGDRKAAVEGLALAGSDAARAMLNELVKDRDKEVRVAVQAALKSIDENKKE